MMVLDTVQVKASKEMIHCVTFQALKYIVNQKKIFALFFFLHCGPVYGYDSIWKCKHNYIIIYLFFAWPALTSSQLSLLLLANTFDSAAEFRLHNPDCQTLRIKKKLLSKSDVLCNIFRLLFVVCSWKMGLNSIKLRSIGEQLLALRWSVCWWPRRVVLFLLCQPTHHLFVTVFFESRLHFIHSFLPPPPHSHTKSPLSPDAAALVAFLVLK